MTYLQLSHLGTLLPTPKPLVMGVDFDAVVTLKRPNGEKSFALVNINTKLPESGIFDIVCNLEDCYKSRSLIEVDGFTEFDICQCCSEDDAFVADLYDITDEDFMMGFENYKSIFLPQNQEAHPELYKQALEIINSKE
jgi:hypothetical protein